MLFLYSHDLTSEERPSGTFGPVVCVDYDLKSTIGYKSSALFPDYITGVGPFPFSSWEGAPNMWICPQDVERKYGGRRKRRFGKHLGWELRGVSLSEVIKWQGGLGQAGSGFISHSHNSPASCGALSGWLAHACLVSEHPWDRQRPFLLWAL